MSGRRGQEGFEAVGGNALGGSLFFFGLLLILAALVANPAFSQSLDGLRSAESGPPVMAFDIPSQPLADALNAYGTATSIQLFFETSLTSGRSSGAVRGSLSRTSALRMLLAGTGLAAVSFDPGTITIVPAPKRPEAVDLRPAKARALAFTPYFALVQERLRSALCQAAATQTDASEIRIQLWIASSGTVVAADLLSSTGSEVRDRAYLNALRALSIGTPPPAMPQPVTLVILPRNSPDVAECGPADKPAPVGGRSDE